MLPGAVHCILWAYFQLFPITHFAANDSCFPRNALQLQLQTYVGIYASDSTRYDKHFLLLLRRVFQEAPYKYNSLALKYVPTFDQAAYRTIVFIISLIIQLLQL